MHRRIVFATAVLLGALTLAGCSRPVVTVEQIDGLPDGVTAPANSDGTPLAFAHSDGLAIVTWGSSSCRPDVADLVTDSEPTKVSFVTPSGTCTDDLAPTTFIFPLDELGGSMPSRVVVTLDGHETQVDVAQ